jgi:hypothetical protein
MRGGLCLDGRDRFAGFNHSHVEEVCSAPSARVGINAVELGYRPPADCESMEGNVVNNCRGGRVEYSETAVLNWCDTCVHVHSTGGEALSVDPLTQRGLFVANIGTLLKLKLTVGLPY